MGQQYEKQSRDCALQNRFTAYLRTALDRKKYNYIQKRVQVKKREVVTDFQGTEFESGPAFNFSRDSHGLSQQEDIALVQALSGLTTRERFILFERVLNGRGYDELAETLGLGYNRVASAYHRAIKKLRKKLRGEGR